MVDVFDKSYNGNRGRWLSPQTVLSFQPTGWNITVPTDSAKQICAGIEDMRLSINEDDFSSMVPRANDELEDDIGAMVLNFRIHEHTNVYWMTPPIG